MKPYSSAFTVDIRRFRVLRELQERGTVLATARALHLTPSAISQQIASLAKEIGVTLLAPKGRGVCLTQKAELLLEHAAAIDAELDRARANLALFDEGLAGTVAIGSFATAISGLLAPVLARLERERPRLRLSIAEIEAPDCFTLLDRGDLDLVITVDHRDGPPHGDARYARQDLLFDPMLIALPPGHALQNKRSIGLLSLSKEAFIVGAVRGPCQEAGLAACAAAGFSPRIVHRVNDWGALLKLVAAGGGVGLVPKLGLGEMLPPGVVLRPIGTPKGTGRRIYAARRAGSERSPGITAVLSALVSTSRSLGGLAP